MGTVNKVTLIIPDHAERQLQTTINRLQYVLGDLPVAICISADPEGRGIGWALRDGVRCVRTEWVIFIMADGSEDPTCVREMVLSCMTDHWTVVFGTRWEVGGTVTHYPLLKRIVNRVGNHLIAILSPLRWYADWTDFAKAYRVKDLWRITWSDDFRASVEIPLRVLRLHIDPQVRIVPMRWRERTSGQSHYQWKHGWGTFTAWLKVLWEA